MRWPARVLGTASASSLLAILVDDALHLRLVPLEPNAFGYGFVTALLLAAAAAPWLVRAARARVVDAKVEDGSVRLGRMRIHRRDVTGLRVVRAERGYAVAIARGRGITFLEIENGAHAAAIARALGPAPPALDLARASKLLRGARVASSAIGVAVAFLYVLAVLGFGVEGAKSTAGIAGVALAHVTAAIAAVSWRRDFLGTPWGEHVALHTRLPHVEAREDAGARPWTARGDEPVEAWLARLDAVPVDASAYRGSGEADVLRGLVADDAAPVDARIGAARVLHVRHGEPREMLKALVDDDDVRVRIEAATEEVDACEKIERLGPVFRYPPRP